MCVCVCVFFPSILDIKFLGRTSRGHTGGRSHRIFNPPSFCGACLDLCVFAFSRDPTVHFLDHFVSDPSVFTAGEDADGGGVRIVQT